MRRELIRVVDDGDDTATDTDGEPAVERGSRVECNYKHDQRLQDIFVFSKPLAVQLLALKTEKRLSRD